MPRSCGLFQLAASNTSDSVQLTLHFPPPGVEGPPLGCVPQVGLVLRADVATSLAGQLRRCKAGWQHRHGVFVDGRACVTHWWGAYLHVC